MAPQAFLCGATSDRRRRHRWCVLCAQGDERGEERQDAGRHLPPRYYPNRRRFAKAAHEFAVYIAENAGSIINYGERFRTGEPRLIHDQHRIRRAQRLDHVVADDVAQGASASQRLRPSTACCRHGPGSPAASARIQPVLRRSGPSRPSRKG
jgi:hypothetical protein